MDYLFLLSNAQEDWSPELEKFFNDLVTVVAARVSLRSHESHQT